MVVQTSAIMTDPYKMLHIRQRFLAPGITMPVQRSKAPMAIALQVSTELLGLHVQ